MLPKGALKAVLLDVSGTLHIDNSAIEGAVEALGRLRRAPLKIRFITNTTKESKKALYDRLTSLGFSLLPDEIFTSLLAARELVVRENLRPLLLLENSALEDFEGIDTQNQNAVVVGLAPSKFNYEYLNKAFNLLQNKASFIAIHKSRYYKKSDGLALGPGPYVAALEYATDTRARVVGKPETLFFKEAIRPLGCDPQEIIMIGDDVFDDIEGAQKIGIIGMLVKTGKYREGDEKKIDPKPSYVYNDLAEAVENIINFYV